jgi:leucyl-tRNA synthetase
VKKLFNQGMLHGSDGFVMAKSRGNVVDPLDMVGKYCADTLRFYLVSNSSPDKDYVWSDSAIEGSSRFLKKVFSYFENVKTGKSSEKTQSRLNSAIKEATQLISEMKYNLAIIQIRELFDSFRKEESREVLESFLKLLHPFCPHLTEEMWEKMGNKNFLSAALWPVADEKKINQQFEQQENLVEQLIADINHILGIVREKKSKVYVYVLPKEKILFEDGMEEVKRRTGLEAELFSVDDKKKYDPENKAKKARPGKPALLLE